jgi:hypothetical protein
MSQAFHQSFSVVCSRSSPLLLLNNPASNEPIRGCHGRIDCACSGSPGLVDDVHDVSQEALIVGYRNSVCGVHRLPGRLTPKGLAVPVINTRNLKYITVNIKASNNV